jgi:transcriptional accessory protein Tex/SPT6
VKAAIDVATVEAIAPHADSDAEARASSRRRRAEPPAAVNDPLTFLTFVSEHPIGSAVEGTVSSFVSHGAMVDVGGMQCYVPLAGLASPAPRRAREVVERGQVQQFILVALDPARRGAELAVPEVAPQRLAR